MIENINKVVELYLNGSEDWFQEDREEADKVLRQKITEVGLYRITDCRGDVEVEKLEENTVEEWKKNNLDQCNEEEKQNLEEHWSVLNDGIMIEIEMENEYCKMFIEDEECCLLEVKK